MKCVGVVGSEAAKFSKSARTRARRAIRELLEQERATHVVSGGCHLGGIDIWAAEIGREMGLEVVEFLPKARSWEGGYRERNLAIAKASSVVYCITVDRLPNDYKGMTFPNGCYHCKTKEHVKSGGCWTVKKAVEMGRCGEVLVVKQ